MLSGHLEFGILEKAEHVAFELKDLFRVNPFHKIYSKGGGDRHFSNAYVDFSQDFETVRIAWQRIKQGCNEIGEIYTMVGTVPSNETQNDEDASLLYREGALMNILQTDVRTFIDIARTLMDKLAKLIEKLLGLSSTKGPRVSFTDHKKCLPLHHPNIHPTYLDYLQNRTYWYEQELLLLRDKIYAHGNTFITSWQVSIDGGIKIIKKSGYGGLEGQSKAVFLDIKGKYEMGCPNLRVIDREYETPDEFLRQIRRLNIKLDDPDVNKLRNIVAAFGITIDEEFLESIARHLEDFMKEVAHIFADPV
jgi:hypothetical protein